MNTCCKPDASTETSRTERVVEPFADVRRSAKGYVVELDLPGVDVPNLSVSVDQGLLTLAGKTTVNWDADKPARHVGFASREFRRAFRLDEGIDRDAIRADFKNGVLRLDIPFKEQPPARKIPVVAQDAPSTGS